MARVICPSPVRRLWSTFQASGLFAGTVHARVLTNTTYAASSYGHARIADLALLAQRGLIAQADYERLLRQVEELAADDSYFYSSTCYAYVGRKQGEAS